MSESKMVGLVKPINISLDRKPSKATLTAKSKLTSSKLDIIASLIRAFEATHYPTPTSESSSSSSLPSRSMTSFPSKPIYQPPLPVTRSPFFSAPSSYPSSTHYHTPTTIASSSDGSDLESELDSPVSSTASIASPLPSPASSLTLDSPNSSIQSFTFDCKNFDEEADHGSGKMKSVQLETFKKTRETKKLESGRCSNSSREAKDDPRNDDELVEEIMNYYGFQEEDDNHSVWSDSDSESYEGEDTITPCTPVVEGEYI
jgi:hypothetical protein